MSTVKNILVKVLHNNFSESFVEHMKNAMMMSFFKHQDKRGNGDINNYCGKISIDMIYRELEAFKKDNNTEHMVNVANYAMIRYMVPQDKESYVPTDSDKSTFNVGITKSVTEHLYDYFKEYN